ncbi:helix-turn-helix domain-containing protein [Hoeflea sp. TYP-13]|uniref:helix-turn-helix domain-containing protein n=1 Tax=Hoeflea sp. TYP-13 TaxID=3230023 RepID=UPI0034C6243B
MSHAATNWAILQRGLKPAAKVVLWHLCDRYHPDNGCFPSQETLAADCEMSRSAVNRNLEALEGAGLIVREKRHDRRTNKRISTRYRFPFEPDFPCPKSGHGSMSQNGAEPCVKNGESHVSNQDTNPVREPVREPVTERERAGAENSDLENLELEASATDEPKLTASQRGKLITRMVERWPKGTGSTETAIAELKKLSDADLVDADAKQQAWLDQWHSTPRRHTHALSTYAKDRLFDQVEVLPEPPPPTTKSVRRGERLWNARFYEIVLTVAMAQLPEPKTDFLRKQIADEGKAGEWARLNHQAKYGWPDAVDMIRADESGHGTSVSLELERLSERFGSVKAGSELWNAWRDYHHQQGWPWAERHSGGAWLPVPVEPDAYDDLAAFVVAAIEDFRAALDDMGAAISGNEESSDDDRAA